MKLEILVFFNFSQLRVCKCSKKKTFRESQISMGIHLTFILIDDKIYSQIVVSLKLINYQNLVCLV